MIKIGYFVKAKINDQIIEAEIVDILKSRDGHEIIYVYVEDNKGDVHPVDYNDIVSY